MKLISVFALLALGASVPAHAAPIMINPVGIVGTALKAGVHPAADFGSTLCRGENGNSRCAPNAVSDWVDGAAQTAAKAIGDLVTTNAEPGVQPVDP
ncbi:hypothetical protein TWF694_007464 [Orbilia ellipsospora]|uniref:Uncharacterized protein n=1 Tax=Orbilia ellipsospora TaxID=2528407 RepID=A0AAV9XL75_9PEZI